MNKIILFQTLVVLASTEVPTGDHSSATNRVPPDHTFPIVTPGTNHWTNTNAAPAIIHSPAKNLPALTNGPTTNQPAISSAPTGLQAQVN